MTDNDDGQEAKRKPLLLTWIDRVPDPAERANLPPGMRRRDSSAKIEDGRLYVAVMQAAPPRGIPDAVTPLAIQLSVIKDDEGAGLVAGQAQVPTAAGRPPTLAEIDAVCHEFARTRVMALMFDGGGIPEGPAYYELVEIAGAVMTGGGAPPPPRM